MVAGGQFNVKNTRDSNGGEGDLACLQVNVEGQTLALGANTIKLGGSSPIAVRAVIPPRVAKNTVSISFDSPGGLSALLNVSMNDTFATAMLRYVVNATGRLFSNTSTVTQFGLSSPAGGSTSTWIPFDQLHYLLHL